MPVCLLFANVPSVVACSVSCCVVLCCVLSPILHHILLLLQESLGGQHVVRLVDAADLAGEEV